MSLACTPRWFFASLRSAVMSDDYKKRNEGEFWLDLLAGILIFGMPFYLPWLIYILWR